MCKISEMNLETAKYYGYEAQSNQLVEECAELIQAVNKYRRVETGLGQPVEVISMRRVRNFTQKERSAVIQVFTLASIR